MATFSAPVRYGSRLREVCCQTKPAVCRRYVVRSLASIASRSWPATLAEPAVGTSSPDRIVRRVDFPEPDAPTTAVSSPDSTLRVRPWSACTSTPSAAKMRTRSVHSICAVIVLPS